MRSSTLAASTVSILAAVHSVRADIPSLKGDLFQDAARMIERCLEYAADKKLSPLSVAVVDESGTPVEFKRQTGAAGVTADAALLKARTAVRVHLPTAALAMQSPIEKDLFLLLQITELPGGVPVSRGGVFIGAVGVSGETPEHDAACARYAVDPESDSAHAKQPTMRSR